VHAARHVAVLEAARDIYKDYPEILRALGLGNQAALTMEIIHRISLNADDESRDELRALGVLVEEGFVAFEVAESDARWPQLARWCAKRDATDIVDTRFSREEEDAATWLQWMGEWIAGYPQPEKNSAYLEASFDLSQYCEQCGMGRVQKAPLRLKAEPKWGKRSFLQVNWIFDVLFTPPAVWEAVFRPAGVERLEVLDTRGKVALANVVQLVLPEADSALATSARTGEECQACKRLKYAPVTRGFRPRFVGEPGAPLVVSQEQFGSGGQVFRLIYGRQSLRQALLPGRVGGLAFGPAEPT
jgi:hypothetical protein